MIGESIYFHEVLEKHFDKKIVMTKEDNEEFRNSTKFWVCHNDYIDTDVKVKDHCHISEKMK